MTPWFLRAYQYTIEFEKKVFTNDPDDSGGPTKFGITLKTLSEWWGISVPVQLLQAMPEKIAQYIFWEKYWRPLNCERMVYSPALGIGVFDMGVLFGVTTSAKTLQKAITQCGEPLKIDGKIGPKTLDALNSFSESSILLNFHDLFCDRIDDIIAKRPKDEKYRNGWKKRVEMLLRPHKI